MWDRGLHNYAGWGLFKVHSQGSISVEITQLFATTFSCQGQNMSRFSQSPEALHFVITGEGMESLHKINWLGTLKWFFRVQSWVCRWVDQWDTLHPTQHRKLSSANIICKSWTLTCIHKWKCFIQKNNVSWPRKITMCGKTTPPIIAINYFRVKRARTCQKGSHAR